VRVYRLANDRSFVDFVLHEEGTKVQKISVSPEDEDFLLNCFVKTMFECGAKWIAGQATRNDEIARYSRHGFTTDAKSKAFALMNPQNAPNGP
jgi:hypothetical protein